MQLSFEGALHILPLVIYAFLFACKPDLVRHTIWLYWEAFRPAGLNPHIDIPLKPHDILLGWIAITITAICGSTTGTSLPIHISTIYAGGWALWRIACIAIVRRMVSAHLSVKNALAHDMITFLVAGAGLSAHLLSLKTGGPLFFWCAVVLLTLALMRWLAIYVRVLLTGSGIPQKVRNLLAITFVEIPLIALTANFISPSTP